MIKNWDSFLMPYRQAVNELIVKLTSIQIQFQKTNDESSIELVTGRVKSINSIQEKMKRRHITEENLENDMEDIAGLRIICQFIDDIYKVANILRNRNDIKILEERDYINNSKPSGYRSYHIVIEYPIQLLNSEKKVLAEIQIRTMSMNFWSTIEHSLSYKYNGSFPENVKKRLKHVAELSFKLDKEMSSIRKDIQTSEKLNNNKGK